MKEIFWRRWCIREDDSLTFALRAVAGATLSFLVPAANTAISSIPSLLKVTENMVHPGGLLALRLALRAVAKATLSSLVPAVNSATSSIPSFLKISENMVHPGGFEPPTARFVAEYSIQLSYGCIGKFILLLILIPLLKPYQVRDGASGRIRTSDRSVRSRVLYPAELRMHREIYFTADIDTATKAISSKRWCIREDSNLRPLGS